MFRERAPGAHTLCVIPPVRQARGRPKMMSAVKREGSLPIFEQGKGSFMNSEKTRGKGEIISCLHLWLPTKRACGSPGAAQMQIGHPGRQAGSQPDLPEKREREEIVIGLNKSQKRSQEAIGNKRVCPQSSPLKPLKWIWPETACVLFP